MQDIHNHSTHRHSIETFLVILFALLALLLLAPRVHSQDAAPRQTLNDLTSRSSGPLPAGTRLLSLRVSDGLAVADFSQEIKANFEGGDSQEVAAVNSILRALGRYPQISRVQIMMEGRPLDSIGGLLVLSSPLPVLRPDQDNGGHTRFLHRKAAPAKAKHTSRTRHALS